MALRDTPPTRRVGRKHCKHYNSYRKTLKEDFDSRCGYCASFDKIRSRSFTIDHFIPQNPEGWTHSLSPTDYYNLVYCCAYCNAAKTNKWPTRDVTKPNDGKVGFIDPVNPIYDQLFNRNDKGEIEVSNAANELANYIYIELNFKRTTHSILWKLEKIDISIRAIKEKAIMTTDGSLQATLYQLLESYHALSDQFFNGNHT
jgi:uncharacterized protein (TIGR02646 family)